MSEASIDSFGRFIRGCKGVRSRGSRISGSQNILRKAVILINDGVSRVTFFLEIRYELFGQRISGASPSFLKSGRLSHQTGLMLLGSAGPGLRRALWLSGERDPLQDRTVPGLRPRRKRSTAIVVGKGDALRLLTGSRAHRGFCRRRRGSPGRGAFAPGVLSASPLKHVYGCSTYLSVIMQPQMLWKNAANIAHSAARALLGRLCALGERFQDSAQHIMDSNY